MSLTIGIFCAIIWPLLGNNLNIVQYETYTTQIFQTRS
jgi:hypothetical protein